MDLEKIERLKHLFFEKDPKRNIQFPLLHFQYNSFKHYLSDISNFKYDQKVPIGDKFYNRIIIDDIKLYYPDKPDRDYITANIPYEIGISYNLKINKGNFTKPAEEEKEVINNSFKNSYTYIPAMVGYESTFPSSNKGIKISGNLGCYFIGNKGIIKTFGNQFAKDYAFPGFKVSKNSKLNFQFKKVVGDFIKYPFLPFKHKIFKIDYDSFKNIVSLSVSGEFKNKGVNIFDIMISMIFNGTGDITNTIETIKKLLLSNSNDEIRLTVYSLLSVYDLMTHDSSTKLSPSAFPHMEDSSDILKFIELIQFLKHFIYAYWTTGTEVDLEKFSMGSYCDKDDPVRYRIKTSGDVMSEIFQRAMNDYTEKIKSFLISGSDINMSTTQPLTLSLSNYYNTSTLPSNDNSCFKWGTGVSAKTIPYHARSVSHKNPGITKNYTTRQLHPGIIGFFDPQDIPDAGKNVALTYSLGLCAFISEHNIEKLKEFKDEIIKYFKSSGQFNIFDTPVALDGSIISFVEPSKVKTIIQELIKKKRNNDFIINDFSVYYLPGYINELRIQSMNGRIIKPMFIVEEGKLNVLQRDIDLKNKTFSDIAETENVIEFVDIEQFRFSNVVISIEEFQKIPEEERVHIDYVAFGENYENGIIASSLYGLNCNNGIRRVFATNQEKNKISLLRKEPKNVIDNGRIICNPQIPIFVNPLTNGKDTRDFKNSNLVRVLVCPYSCENQEDGVIVNTNFVNSGGFDVILLKKENISVDNTFFNVALSEKNTPKSYAKLNPEGYVGAGTILEYKDSLCKNIVSSNFGDAGIQGNSIMDRSAKFKSEIPARVERTYVKNSIKETNIKMLLVSLVGMNMGCKVTNQSAQKATVVFHRREKELPYNCEGERPDIIVNNISILSRKTISLYKTTTLALAFALSPFIGGILRKIKLDSFDKKTIEDIYEFFLECKKDYYGKDTDEDISETMYDPYTFMPYENKMFFSVIDLSRLKHIAEEKIIVVGRANKSKQTGQAVEGKSKGGGQRFSEMARNCLMCYGATDLISNLFNDKEEDSGIKYICKTCGDFIKIEAGKLFTKKYCERCTNLKKDTYMERIDYNKASVVKKEIINARGIKTKFIFDDSNNRLKYYE